MKKLLLEKAVMVYKASNDQQLKENANSKRLSYLVESDGSGMLRVKLPVTNLDKLNENNRTYSTNLMEQVCVRSKSSFESKELLSSVMEHPSEPYVTPGEASHVVVNAWCENGCLWNEWLVLDTTNGKNLRALIESGVAFGVSIRGLGAEDNFGNILEDYEYLGTDCVGQPSAKIRTAPVKLSESENQKPTVPSTTPSLQTERKSDMNMKTKEDVAKFVKEQVTLAGTEPKLAAIKRLNEAEQRIIESSVSSKDLSELHVAIDNERVKILESGGTDAKRETTFRETVTNLTEKFKKSQDSLKSMLQETSTKLLSTEERLKKYRSRFLQTEAAKIKLEKELDETKVELAKIQEQLDFNLKSSKKIVENLKTTRIVAIESTAKYKYLLKTAGKMVRQAKTEKQKTLAKKPTIENSGNNTIVLKTVVKESKVDAKKKGGYDYTAANRSGSVRQPGWI